MSEDKRTRCVVLGIPGSTVASSANSQTWVCPRWASPVRCPPYFCVDVDYSGTVFFLMVSSVVVCSVVSWYGMATHCPVCLFVYIYIQRELRCFFRFLAFLVCLYERSRRDLWRHRSAVGVVNQSGVPPFHRRTWFFMLLCYFLLILFISKIWL